MLVNIGTSLQDLSLRRNSRTLTLSRKQYHRRESASTAWRPLPFLGTISLASALAVNSACVASFVSTISAAKFIECLITCTKAARILQQSDYIGTINLRGVLVVNSASVTSFISTISADEIRRVFNNMQKRCQASTAAE